MATNTEGMNWSRFYGARTHRYVYPTEFVVRTFLSDYPHLEFEKPKEGSTVLDVACGDGRNTAFLCNMGLSVSAVEISDEIVSQTRLRMESLGHEVDARVGRNSSLPYDDNTFDYLLACHCCYYCDPDETIVHNLKEYARVVKPGGGIVASVADAGSYIFKKSLKLADGTSLIEGDPYGNRDGCRLQSFCSVDAVASVFSMFLEGLSFGRAQNDYYGVDERVFWVVGRNAKSDASRRPAQG